MALTPSGSELLPNSNLSPARKSVKIDCKIMDSYLVKALGPATRTVSSLVTSSEEESPMSTHDGHQRR